MNTPTVTCLQLSYGRPQLSVEAVECFLRQTYTNKKLIIINTHPSPVYFKTEQPNITVYNIKPLEHLSDTYRFGLDKIESEYFCIWDDDDLFLPWHIEDRVKAIQEHPEYDAIGHQFGFYMEANEVKDLVGNMFVSQYLYKNNGYRPDKNICLWDVSWYNNPWKRHHINFPQKPSYVYRWGTGENHMSGLGNNEENVHSLYLLNQNTKNEISFDFPWEPTWKHDYIEMTDKYLKTKKII